MHELLAVEAQAALGSVKAAVRIEWDRPAEYLLLPEPFELVLQTPYIRLRKRRKLIDSLSATAAGDHDLVFEHDP